MSLAARVLRAALWAIFDLLSAALDQLLEMPMCFALAGLIMRRERGEPFDGFDVGSVVVVVVGAGLLAWWAVRGRERSITTAYPSATVPLRAITWAHLLFDACWIAFGLAVLEASIDGPGRADGLGRDYGFGIGFLVGAGGLMLLRLGLVVRRWRAAR